MFGRSLENDEPEDTIVRFNIDTIDSHNLFPKIRCSLRKTDTTCTETSRDRAVKFQAIVSVCRVVCNVFVSICLCILLHIVNTEYYAFFVCVCVCMCVFGVLWFVVVKSRSVNCSRESQEENDATWYGVYVLDGCFFWVGGWFWFVWWLRGFAAVVSTFNTLRLYVEHSPV